MLKQIRVHGRGGQGAVTSCELLAIAAFKDGKYSQSFPFFGVARRGAPVMAFTRIDDKFIRLREQVTKPDYVMVLDPTLIDVIDVHEGITDTGIIIVNTSKSPSELNIKTKAKVVTVDITKISLEIIGAPFVNTPMLGAFAKVIGEVSLKSIILAIEEKMPEKIAKKNIDAVKKVFEVTKL
ncbi:pyruvate ferredoxin oxidoreductase subunit gamma [archaeon]|nr:pyruvate ferredoxin oxidoreductase subunit gamma [archaeon]